MYHIVTDTFPELQPNNVNSHNPHFFVYTKDEIFDLSDFAEMKDYYTLLIWVVMVKNAFITNSILTFENNTYQSQ